MAGTISPHWPTQNNVCNSVSFTDSDLKLDVVMVDNHFQHMLLAWDLMIVYLQGLTKTVITLLLLTR